MNLEHPAKVQMEKEFKPFKGTIGIDIIFVKDLSGNTVPKVVEVNGHNSGINGLVKALKGADKYFHRIRTHTKSFPSNEYEKIFKEYEQCWEQIKRIMSDNKSKGVNYFNNHEAFDLLEAESNKLNFLKQRLSEEELRATSFEGTHTHANTNSELVTLVLDNKNLQEKIIPDKYKIRSYKEGENIISSTGYWIVKPAGGMQGKGIQRPMTNKEFAEWLKSNADHAIFYNIQEFFEALPAEKATDELINRKASMRFLIDFYIDEIGEIHIEYANGYQRVAKSNQSEKPDINDSVVNLSMGAKAVTASVREKEIGMQIGREIIQNLVIFSTQNIF